MFGSLFGGSHNDEVEQRKRKLQTKVSSIEMGLKEIDRDLDDYMEEINNYKTDLDFLEMEISKLKFEGKEDKARGLEESYSSTKELVERLEKEYKDLLKAREEKTNELWRLNNEIAQLGGW